MESYPNLLGASTIYLCVFLFCIYLLYILKFNLFHLILYSGIYAPKSKLNKGINREMTEY